MRLIKFNVVREEYDPEKIKKLISEGYKEVVSEGAEPKQPKARQPLNQ